MYWFIGLIIVVFSVMCNAETWRLKRHVFRGDAPVVGDLFEVKNADQHIAINEKLNTQLLISKNKSWYLASALLSDALGYQVEVPGKVWVELCNVFNLEDLSGEISSQLNRQIDRKDVRIVDVVVPRQQELCVDSDIKHLTFSLANSEYFSETVSVDVKGPAGTVTQLILTLTLEVYAPTIDKRVEKGDLVEISRTDYSWVEMQRFHLRQLITDQNLHVYTTKNLNKGAVLSFKNVRRKTLVEKGTSVLVTVSKGALQIESKGRALKSGNLGDRISVLVVGAQSPVIGQITKEGNINVEVF